MKNIWRKVLKYIESYFKSFSPTEFAFQWFEISIILTPILFLIDESSLLQVSIGFFITLLIVASFPFSFYIVTKNPFKSKIINHINLSHKHNKEIDRLIKKYNSSTSYPSTGWRTFKLLIFSLISIFLLYALGKFSEISDIFPLLESPEKDTSGSFIKIQYLIITAPIIYIIWAFRDHNKLIELENTRKDTNLKEFQQLQQWATGNIPNEGDNEQKTSLQISALHSLRPYLRGEYGQSFRRGAYEIFRSTLETQHSKILDKVEKTEDLTIEQAINQDQLTKQLNIIASEEWFNLLINHDFPLGDISLVGVDLSGTEDKPKYLQHRHFGERLNLRGANLTGANLRQVNLTGANLWGARLNGANLWGARLNGANFGGAKLAGVNLWSATLTGADLSYAMLTGAHLRDSKLTGANFGGADLIGVTSSKGLFVPIKFENSIDKETNLSGVNTTLLSEEEKEHIIATLKNIDKYYINGAIKRIETTTNPYDISEAKTGVLTQEMYDDLVKQYPMLKES